MRIQRNPRSRQGARLAAEIAGQSASKATPHLLISQATPSAWAA